MAIVLKDRVKQTAAAPGTGTITLSGSVSGFQAFSAIGNGNVTYFAIVDPVSGAWEVNYGTYTSSGTTLSRNATPLSSSAAGALVNFTGGVDVFCTYPSSKAIYEETSGNVLIDGGPITVIGTGVTSYTTFGAALAELYANVNSFAQFYAQNLNGGASASTDIVAYNNLGDGTYNFVDMGIASSNYTEAAYPIFTPGSAYLYNDGGELIIGTSTATKDVLLFAGGVATTNWAARISGTDQSISTKAGLTVGGALGVTGAATFSSTVELSANPTTALQAATKQYVDNIAAAGIHIHTPVRVNTVGNLTVTYTGGGTSANITQIASGTNITFSAAPSVGDQFYIGTSSNGLIANTAYFVVNIVSGATVQASLTYGGAIVSGLTNGTPTIAATINSGVGATITNAGTQAALAIDGVTLSVGNRVLVGLQTSGAQNGVYTVTNVGSGATNWLMTRATDANRVIPEDPAGLGTGDYFYVQEGTQGQGDSYVLTTEPNTMIIGYTPLTYTQFSGAITYTGGTNIDVTGQVISVTGAIGATNGGTGTATVATGNLLYGSGTNTWSKLALGSAYRSLVVNGAGTNVEWNAVALNQSGAVSGALPATNGGTGLSSYTLGDTIYSSAANTLLNLAGNTTTTKKFLTQTGTGAVSAAPAWGTISGSDVSGNISGSAGSVANALTLGTYLTGTSFNGSAAVTATVDATSANTASKVVARDVSGNFSAGTITAALTGNASTATAATNIAGGAANQIPYNTAAATTTYIAAPTVGSTYLNWTGSAFAWSAISVPNSLTINNGGAGGASGSTFNGSAALTISYNTVGASPLAGSSSLTTTGTVTSGTWSASFGAVSGANLTSLTAGNLSGTIPSAVLGNSTAYVGTTAVALNRASANQALTGISSITLPGATSGTAQITPNAVAGTGTVLTLPATTGTLALTSDITTVNNGTLTLAVAGTGLSGSQTFTANQASAATFTVTSNATNANTASTIVARDASGNFTAGTITAALTGTASTATNVAGGVAGAVHYQSGVGTTGFSAAGTSGQVLTSAATAAPTWTTSTSANTASAIVQRDGSGNFSAGTITAALSGNASTATTATNQSGGTVAATTGTFSSTLGVTGRASLNGGFQGTVARGSYGSVSLYGTNSNYSGIDINDQAVTWMTNIAGGVSFGVYKTNTTWAFYFDQNGTLTAGAVPYSLLSGTVPTWNQNTTGNAATATTATNQSGGTVSGTTGTFSGVLTTPKTLINRSAAAACGIGWYNSSFSAWTDYMSPAAATGCGPFANITAPTGTLVTSWGLRRFIENTAGYGWTFESGTSSQVTPTVVAEIRASDGAARFGGQVTAPSAYFSTGLEVSGTATIYESATPTTGRIFLNGYQTRSISYDGTYYQMPSSGLRLDNLGVGTNPSGTTGEIRATNNITAYYSDDRLKTRLGKIENALDKIKTLDSFYYEANQTAQDLGYKPVREVGISAQQVQAIMPEVVAPAPIDDKYLTVRYERLVPLLLAAINELEAKVANLENREKL